MPRIKRISAALLAIAINFLCLLIVFFFSTSFTVAFNYLFNVTFIFIFTVDKAFAFLNTFTRNVKCVGAGPGRPPLHL